MKYIISLICLCACLACCQTVKKDKTEIKKIINDAINEEIDSVTCEKKNSEKKHIDKNVSGQTAGSQNK